MKTINKILLVALAMVSFSCDDILEDDISNDTVQTIAPLNGEEIESNVAKFQWGSLKGADKYRVQVFAANQTVVLDSLVENKTSLTYPLSEGVYQWRVRGENFAYQSAYSVQSSFTMFVSDDLTNQQVVLSSPDDDIFINFTNVTLNWLTLTNATSYSIEVVNVANGQQAFQNPTITGTSVTMNNPGLADGVYEWRVKAKNANNDTETLQYSHRKFSLDRTVPNQPGFAQGSTPPDSLTPVLAPNTTITFTWTNPADSGSVMSPVTYMVQFSNDNFATAPFLSADAPQTTYSQSFSAGTYYWRVVAKDKAGNTSVPSVIRKFVVG
ncbi:hypothetical protein [Flavobacterium humi]|uniref:Fibronectin type-III domain-containing protein n=1 Tax=Flavobacterium humi TaxID=2562683 RepID=A0A4Z0L6P8_9FLAO|nr:hypothetical protein [Flavobacterium humi]TGD56844.1 hypothetical protein E4635_13675 [Flavobacterium humi]